MVGVVLIFVPEKRDDNGSDDDDDDVNDTGGGSDVDDDFEYHTDDHCNTNHKIQVNPSYLPDLSSNQFNGEKITFFNTLCMQ